MLRSTPKILPAGLPPCLKKRRLLNDPGMSPAVCRQYGEKFLEVGWWEDALEFFHRGNDAAGREKIKAHCLETGDAYLLARLGKQAPEVWRRVGEAALSRGKFHFARRAFELAGDEDQTAMVAGLIAGRANAPQD